IISFFLLSFSLLILRPQSSTLFPYTTLLPISQGNRAQILDEYGRPVLGHHRHVRQIIERFQIAQPANHVSGTAQFQYAATDFVRSEEHTSELQSRGHLVCRLLLEKKKE